MLAGRIRASGPIPFAEFMRESLYHPDYGYYSRLGVRRRGDYYTSVDVHPIFGRLIARQLAEMWELLGSPVPFLAVESGAGVGRLAANILDFAARELPSFYAAVRYIAVERSAARRAEHEAALASHAPNGRVSSSAEIPAKITTGCIFSNELLDALPTHRVVMDAGHLREVHVGFEDGRFVEVLREPSTPAIERFFHEQGIALSEGHHAEACLDACRWIEATGRAVSQGFVMTIDYGHEAPVLYDERSPSHRRRARIAR
jgi:SAM-dependent MidA family methyltransferase